MKKVLSVLLIALFGIGILYLGFAARAQHFYLGMYWIAGGVTAPEGVTTADRQVVFFKGPLDNNQIVGGYSDDVVGPTGLSGQPNQYIINAFEDYRLNIVPGIYQVAIPNDNPSDPASGYGADPVDVVVTGKGYEIVPVDLAITLGAGLLPPAERPEAGAEWAPRFEDIRFGKRLYQPALVAKGQEFIISSQSRISAKVISEGGLDTSKIYMVVNEGTSTAKTYSIAQTAKISAVGAADAPTEVDFVLDLFNLGETFPDGDNEINFKATNAFGSTLEVASVTVVGGEARLIGIPITFPSPLHLMRTNSVIFQYTLTKDIPVDIFLFDVSGRVAKKITCYARDEGGSAGVNKVSWNLITDQGQKVASGIYVFTLINRETGKLLGKGKFTALP